MSEIGLLRHWLVIRPEGRKDHAIVEAFCYQIDSKLGLVLKNAKGGWVRVEMKDWLCIAEVSGKDVKGSHYNPYFEQFGQARARGQGSEQGVRDDGGVPSGRGSDDGKVQAGAE
jgi:hypothetical protein